MRKFDIVSPEFRKHPDVKIELPKRSTKKSCGYDFVSPADYTVWSMGVVDIWTDVKAYMNEQEELIINVRSSAGKVPFMLANSQAWIEADFADNPTTGGNILLRIFNLSENKYTIHKGDHIAQGMFINWLKTDDDDADGERTGGDGSTGA